MSALQRKYFGGGKRRRRSVAKVHRRRRRSVAALRINPRRRRHSVRVTRRRYRHNPSFGGMSLSGVTRSIVPTLKAGALGASGALINDLAYGYLKGYLPTMLTTGNAALATRAMFAVLSGVLGNLVLKGKGRELANGAMTVVLHDAAVTTLKGFMPSLPLGEYLSAGPAVGYSGVRRLRQPAVQFRTMAGMGEYLSDTTFANGIPTG